MHTAVSESVVTIDTHYIEPGRAAAYLIRAGDRAAFVDNNTSYAVPRLLEALEARGLRPEQVEYAIITHVHLDHASGTAALLEACPRAVALAHPRAARHLVNPSRLVASAMQVYGEEAFRRLYGRIDPIPADRVRAVEDEEVLAFGDRTLRFLHTPGHARHHICIYDSGSNGIFTGDAFGISFPPLRRGARPYLLASTPPTDFDADAARDTVRRIVATGAEVAYLTHYGPFAPVDAGAEELLRSIDEMEAVFRAAVDSGKTGDELRALAGEGVRAAAMRQLERCGVTPGREDEAWIAGDVHMNALGLAYAAERARPREGRKDKQ